MYLLTNYHAVIPTYSQASSPSQRARWCTLIRQQCMQNSDSSHASMTRSAFLNRKSSFAKISVHNILPGWLVLGMTISHFSSHFFPDFSTPFQRKNSVRQRKKKDRERKLSNPDMKHFSIQQLTPNVSVK